MPETSVHVLDKNREISPLEREEGYGGKDLEKRWVLGREWKTLWDTPTTDLNDSAYCVAHCSRAAVAHRCRTRRMFMTQNVN